MLRPVNPKVGFSRDLIRFAYGQILNLMFRQCHVKHTTGLDTVQYSATACTFRPGLRRMHSQTRYFLKYHIRLSAKRERNILASGFPPATRGSKLQLPA